MAERTVVAPGETAGHPGCEPFLRVVRGNPTPDEIAALVAVFLVCDSEATGTAPRPRHRRYLAWAGLEYLLHRLRRHAFTAHTG